MRYPPEMKSLSSLVVLVLVLAACQPEVELVSGSGALHLRVSTDTVLFDTLLTNRGSITRRFKIYNPNSSAIKFDAIRLGKGDASPYDLIINGRQGQELQNEVLFGKDSLQVLVTVFIDPQDENAPFLVKDSVVFDWNGNSGHVKLVAYGQDAIYVNADTLCDVTWTSERPYVIYNYALVDTLCTLTIDPGARIYLDNGASLLFKGNLHAIGSPTERITFRNTRFDAKYDIAPGQWNSLVFLESSANNQIHYADILNGQIGIAAGYTIASSGEGIALIPENGDLTTSIDIQHTTISHMSYAGILGFSSEMYVSNTAVYNCGQYVVGNFAGGTYQYDHCTLVNFPNFFVRDEPSVQFSDNVVVGTQTFSDNLSITLRNTIIWGNQSNELLIAEGGFGSVTKQFLTGIVRSTLPVSNHFISQEFNFPGFLSPQTFDYRLDSLAFARDKGSVIGITTDLSGILRDVKPDIGAYEYVPEEEE